MTNRPYVAPSVTRSDPGMPAAGTTLHAIGDVHASPISASQIEWWRQDAVVRDSLLPRVGRPAAIIQLGDTTNNTPSTDTQPYLDFMGRLANPDSVPWHNVMGNHDLYNDVQTPAQWAASMGLAQPSYWVDMPTLRLVMWSPMLDFATNYVAHATEIAWLDAAIGGTTLPVFVCCHFPLYDTVSGISGFDALSTQETAFIRSTGKDNSDDVLDVLAAHPNFKAWLSGHTHSRIEVPGLVMPMVYAGHKFASINTSCIWFTGSAPGRADDTVNTLYVTWLDDKIEVRPRNHGGGVWASPNGKAVLTVTGLG